MEMGGFFCRGLFIMVVAASMAEMVYSDQRHAVGGDEGWQEATDFDAWASAQTFKVGDQLVFKYASGLHSVVELPDESAYKSCDLGSVLESKSSGNDIIKLTKPGTRYFACGTLGHCSQGMKLKIKTAAGNAPSSPSSPSSSSTSGSSASTNSKYSSLPLLISAVASFALLWLALP